MKKLLICLCLLTAIRSSAQMRISYSSGTLFMSEYDEKGFVITSKAREVKGVAWLNENWGTGYVKFLNDKIFPNVKLRFNLFTNELRYQLDSTEFAFVEPVKEFSFSYKESDNELFVLYRNGYPGNKPDSKQLFYEVISEGKRFHLLKRIFLTIHEGYTHTAATALYYRQSQQWYLFDKRSGSMTEIKNKQSLSESIPGIGDVIVKLTGKKSGKFKSEKELVEIISQSDQ